MKKLSFYLGLLLIPLAISSTRCKDKPKDEQVDVRLVIPMSITPMRDTFNINDTLLFEISTPDTILELTTNKYYKFENFNLNSFISIRKLSSNTGIFADQPGAISKFSYTNITGGMSNFSGTFTDVNFIYSNNGYIAKCKIACKETGTYSIHTIDRYGRTTFRLTNIDIGSTPSGGKKIPILNEIRYTINNGQINYHILKDNCLTEEERFGQKPWYEVNGIFSFVVK
jgi:hypothetical protein